MLVKVYRNRNGTWIGRHDSTGADQARVLCSDGKVRRTCRLTPGGAAVRVRYEGKQVTVSGKVYVDKRSGSVLFFVDPDSGNGILLPWFWLVGENGEHTPVKS